MTGGRRLSRAWASVISLMFGTLLAEGSAADSQWRIVVVKVRKPATIPLVAETAPGIRGRIVKPLLIEQEEERLERSYLVDVDIRNLSDSAMSLRWDVSRSPHLVLPDGRTLRPLGHKLHGLEETSLAEQGVLEVNVPPRE